MHQNKPIFCITPFPYHGDFDEFRSEKSNNGHPDLFRAKLEQIVLELNSPYVYLVKGPELLTDFTGLSPDLVHPSDVGMTEIASKLSSKINSILDLKSPYVV